MASWLLACSSHLHFFTGRKSILLQDRISFSSVPHTVPPTSGCVTLGWTLYLSEPQCPSVPRSHPGTQGKARKRGCPVRTASSSVCAPPRSALETRVQALETQQQAELASLRGEKERLRRLLGRQSGALAGLESSLRAARSNSSLLQRQQSKLLESVQRLVRVVAQGLGEPASGCTGEGGEREERGDPAYPPRSLWGLEATGGKALSVSRPVK